MCVFVSQGSQLSTGWSYIAFGIWTLPSCQAHCLPDNRIFPSPLPSLHPSSLLPLLKSHQTGKPLLSSSTSVRVSILSFFISVLPLSAIISPPLFSSLRRVHPPPLLQSNPTAINQLLVSSRGRLVSAASSLSHCLLHPACTLSPHLCLLSSLPSPLSLTPFIFPVEFKQMAYARFYKCIE